MGPKLPTQAIVLPFYLKEWWLAWMLALEYMLGNPGRKTDSISMEYHKILKEICLSYFCNIIKSRSEYFEYGIIHFPKNQPRTTLGFAWKPTAARGKCHHAATPASLFPGGREWEPHAPPLTSPTLPFSVSVPQNTGPITFSLACHTGEPQSLRWEVWLCPPRSQGLSIGPRKPQNWVLTNMLGSTTLKYNTKKARQEYFSSLQMGLRTKKVGRQ